jgi:hypothetical protein
VNNEPLPVHLHSVIVKRSSVTKSYPGGLEEFDRVHPSRQNEELSVLSAMSLSDVDWLLDKLFAAGLVPGVDVAVAEMRHGPILTCPGVAFRSDEAMFFPSWTVEVCEPPENAGGSWNGGEAYTPDNAFGYFWLPPGIEAHQEAPRAVMPEPIAPAPQAAEAAPNEAEGGRGPTRVVFGSGPVHWLYHDDEPDEEYD